MTNYYSRSHNKIKIDKSQLFLISSIVLICYGGYYSLRNRAIQNIEEPTLAPKIAPCPDDYTLLKTTGHCYKLNNIPMEFDDAEEHCKSENAHLASIHSEEENLFLSGLYHSGMEKSNESELDVWIGISLKNGEIQWTDGSLLDYQDWNFKTFKGKRKRDLFGYMKVFDSSWHFSTSGELRKFICKKPVNPLQNSENLEVSNIPKNCENGFTYFSETGKCYQFHQKNSFKKATLTCEASGSHLVSIHSGTENLFILGLSMKHRDTSADTILSFLHFGIWLGLTRNNDGKFEWSDGSPLDYMNWAASQPADWMRHFSMSPDGGRWTGSAVMAAFVCQK